MPTHSPHPSMSAKYTVPPMPPQIHRKISLGRSDEGVFLFTQIDEPSEGVLIKWGVKGALSAWKGEAEELVELGGILGIIRLWDNAYLLVFLPTEAVPLFPTQADGSYRVNTLGAVYSIPLHPDLASTAISQLQSVQNAARRKASATGSRWSFGLNLKASPKEASELQALADSAEGESSDEEDEGATTDAETTDAEGTMGSMSRESIAPEADEDPIVSQGKNKNRFSWNKFLPIRRPAKPASASTPTTKEEGEETVPELPRESEDPAGGASTSERPSDKPFPSDPPQRRELETKIIRQITREFSAGGFFYSHNFDLTHSLQAKRKKLSSRHTADHALAALLKNPSTSSVSLPASESSDNAQQDDFIEPDIQIPLWRRADKRFFWNEYLMKDFINAGFHAFILPVMQGWVQSSQFAMGGVPIDFVVISRRSRERAGLRYQRRGIDDEGHVANMVETEMIVRAKVENKASLFSFVQVRGSIPLKWSQSPYSMKPPPVLDVPVDQTYSVANLHFNDITSRYGHITIINLSEQNGKEGIVTNAYGELVEKLERDDLTYKPFDFHAKCHGMKWENISELVEELDFGTMGYYWSLANEPLREQEGAFRTNCIDCLDRTNVVQSAIARRVLTEMLTQLGIVPSLSDVENVFNDVWANNGDILSLCYAHTSALKGDFVRTGKRDIQGMLNDGISSLSRMFYGAISDFFAQAVISYFLGHRNLGVFSEFLASLESSDVSNFSQMSRVRAAAVETSSARVINEEERKLAGWVLLSPEEKGVKLSAKLEEKILLLTTTAIYVVSFNYPLDKVVGFTQIPLVSITTLQEGAYILSALNEASRDPNENAGFAIEFSPGKESTRYSTYSMRNDRRDSDELMEDPDDKTLSAESVEFYAFKVLPMEFGDNAEDDSDDEDGAATTCKEMSGKIVRRIHRQCRKQSGAVEVVVEKDIVSLTEAEKSTGVLAKVDYALKRFLWL